MPLKRKHSTTGDDTENPDSDTYSELPQSVRATQWSRWRAQHQTRDMIGASGATDLKWTKTPRPMKESQEPWSVYQAMQQCNMAQEWLVCPFFVPSL